MDNSATNSEPLVVDLSIPFPTSREAEIAYGTLSVDAEPKRSSVKKTVVHKDNMLHIHFESNDARFLRVSVNTFFDHLGLVVQTMERFGPPRLK
ncbi:hypothetical protein ACJMK2_023662 [Sinanodonta woodiana]|uniref:L antigen family member 3 n=1 Tax=Sinanodonta woodiana TaxID=1069815 RepID=A0ABD3T4X8_SINWO